MFQKKNISNGIKDRVKKTRLYVIETGKWAAGNASALMDLLTTGVRTAASSLCARNAAVDISHADLKKRFMAILIFLKKKKYFRINKNRTRTWTLVFNI